MLHIYIYIYNFLGRNYLSYCNNNKDANNFAEGIYIVLFSSCKKEYIITELKNLKNRTS